MLHFRTLNNKINRIHARALRTAYSDYRSSSHELLDKDSSFTICQKKSHILPLKFMNTFMAYLQQY